MKNLNVLIIEDEIPAQTNLQRAIERNFEDLHIGAVLGSVKSAVEWLRNPQNKADIIFMDVELSDGMCFDIFSQTSVSGKVVITTAFDSYAIKAFRINSIDYLLKPVDPEELRAAVERCRTAIEQEHAAPMLNLESLRSALSGESCDYKKRFVVKVGDRIAVVPVEEVAYFYAEDKSTYLTTRENRRYILDMSLDTASEQVDPRAFFRISRNCTAAISSIAGISKHLSNRLKVTLEPKLDDEVFVSRSRTQDFMDWLEGK